MWSWKQIGIEAIKFFISCTFQISSQRFDELCENCIKLLISIYCFAQWCVNEFESLVLNWFNLRHRDYGFDRILRICALHKVKDSAFSRASKRFIRHLFVDLLKLVAKLVVRVKEAVRMLGSCIQKIFFNYLLSICKTIRWCSVIRDHSVE
jgi:hypothetical protein